MLMPACPAETRHGLPTGPRTCHHRQPWACWPRHPQRPHPCPLKASISPSCHPSPRCPRESLAHSPSRERSPHNAQTSTSTRWRGPQDAHQPQRPAPRAAPATKIGTTAQLAHRGPPSQQPNQKAPSKSRALTKQGNPAPPSRGPCPRPVPNAIPRPVPSHRPSERVPRAVPPSVPASITLHDSCRLPARGAPRASHAGLARHRCEVLTGRYYWVSGPTVSIIVRG